MQNLTSLKWAGAGVRQGVLQCHHQTYNTAVKVFGLKLDAYKADAQVYEVKMRGLWLPLSCTRLRLQPWKPWSTWTARWTSTRPMDIRRSLGTQVDAVAPEDEGRFSDRCSVYAAQAAESETRRASLEGELAKVKVYSAQVVKPATRENQRPLTRELGEGRGHHARAAVQLPRPTQYESQSGLQRHSSWLRARWRASSSRRRVRRWRRSSVETSRRRSCAPAQ